MKYLKGEESKILQKERNILRDRHNRLFRPLKKALYLDKSSDIHHEWIEHTAKYTTITLVDKKLHREDIIVKIIQLFPKIKIYDSFRKSEIELILNWKFGKGNNNEMEEVKAIDMPDEVKEVKEVEGSMRCENDR